jgi:membrane-associated phospholipid phosphatase
MKLTKLIPGYSILPVILLLALNILTYNGSRLFTGYMHHYDISTPLDHALPFVPEFIIIYLLAFVQWISGYVIIARESKEVCYKIFSAEMFAKVCCLICFCVLPTTLVRPEITGSGFFDRVCSMVYSIDAPDNLFPSIHCLESWVVFRGALYVKKLPGWYKWVTLVFSLLVFASTVLVKQHVVLDMAGAVFFVELGMILTEKFHFDRIFAGLQRVLSR